MRLEAPGFLFSTDDFEMCLADVQGRTAIDDRLVALTAAFALWRNGGQAEKDCERMWSAVQGEPDLEARLHALLHSEPLSEVEQCPRYSRQDFRRRQAERQAQQEEVRREQIARLRGNVDCIRSVNQETVVSLHLTDNSAVGTCGKRVSFHHRDRGDQHGTAPVVFPPPPGRSRGDLPPQAGLVA